MQSIKVKDVVFAAWEVFEKNIRLCVLAAGLMLLISLGALGLEKILSLFGLGFFSSVIGTAITFYGTLGLNFIILNLARNNEVKLANFFAVNDIYFKALFLYLLFFIICISGLVLLIVPGIIFYLGFGFYLLCLLENKEKTLLENLRYSWRITRGFKWNIFLFSLITIVLNVLGLISLVIGLVFTIPLTTLIAIELYKRLKDIYEQNNLGENSCHT